MLQNRRGERERHCMVKLGRKTDRQTDRQRDRQTKEREMKRERERMLWPDRHLDQD